MQKIRGSRNAQEDSRGRVIPLWVNMIAESCAIYFLCGRDFEEVGGGGGGVGGVSLGLPPEGKKRNKARSESEYINKNQSLGNGELAP